MENFVNIKNIPEQSSQEDEDKKTEVILERIEEEFPEYELICENKQSSPVSSEYYYMFTIKGEDIQTTFLVNVLDYDVIKQKMEDIIESYDKMLEAA